MSIKNHKWTLSFKISHKLSYAQFRWNTNQHMNIIFTSICLYYFNTFCSHNFLNIIPISDFIFPYIICLLYFGANTMWYLQFQRARLLFPLSFVFQTWIFLLCYFSCGRQTCFDCSMGGLSFPSHRLSLFYSTGIARGCLFQQSKSLRRLAEAFYVLPSWFIMQAVT